LAAIRVLPSDEARKIAAGEVVDRPAALVREFLDNAIDSGALSIEVLLEGGGRRKVEVSDDGRGMERDDLEICWLPHATSKIRSLGDLSFARTLGFRGEALAAAAAVSKLEIASCAKGAEAWRLEVGPGEAAGARIERAARTRGSTVRALNLFDSTPARKGFLKREGSEGALCRQVLVEKALAFPEIAFRLAQDGRPKDFFPVAGSLKERFAAALPDARGKSFLHEIRVAGDGFRADVVIGGPELFRADRRALHVFANGRRIQDYYLMLAVENGARGFFPNGTHPVGAVFLDIDPALADFNVHPAKREARFRDAAAIHQAVSEGLRDFFRRLGLKSGAAAAPAGRSAGAGASLAFEALGDPARGARREALGEGFFPEPASRAGERADAGFFPSAAKVAAAVAPVADEVPLYGEPRFAGRAFGLFLLAEWGGRLFAIDQHAAHERILYDRFMSGEIPAQELLVPIFFVAESADDDGFIEARRGELARMALAIERDGDGWRVDSLPVGWKLGDSETAREILALSRSGASAVERWAALCCCHQATRDGDYLDDATAASLAREALSLPDPRCPHGRPIWAEISREALLRAVRRT